MNINRNYQALKEDYLFATVAAKVRDFKGAHPDAHLIRMDIGDVTRPLGDSVVSALKRAAEDMGRAATFRGYGPYEGYDFLRRAVADYYAGRGVSVRVNDVFVSEGAKGDIAHFLDLFAADNRVLIPDPVYPVYRDVNLIAGREIAFMDANQANGFLPLPDASTSADIIYLCSPNNPTGAVYPREGLKAWVDYALKNDALILFDAAYEAFVGDQSLPRSIFEIDGARECAVEFCSLSKTAGFTGLRCGYTVVPEELTRGGQRLNKMWLRHQSTKYNGVSYVVQRAAEAAFSAEGRREIASAIEGYTANARLIAATLEDLNIWFTGGHNSPYIWLKCPNRMDSWQFFEHLLLGAAVSGTPGAGFGANGEGYFRFTAFASADDTRTAMARLRKVN